MSTCRDSQAAESAQSWDNLVLYGHFRLRMSWAREVREVRIQEVSVREAKRGMLE